MRRKPAPAIGADAETALAPLGCRQRGRSNVWIADERYWLIVVQFEPDRARVTVGVHWLWYPQPRWCFDAGVRADAADAGTEAAGVLAARAAAEVAALRASFPSPAAVARHLAAAASGDQAWPLYHAGVAAGLAGDGAAAERFFARLGALPARHGWEAEVRAQAGVLAGALPDRAGFRAAAGAIIARTRALQGLPALADALDPGSTRLPAARAQG